MVCFFGSEYTANETSLDPRDALIPKMPFSFCFFEFRVRMTCGARGVGPGWILDGISSMEPVFGSPGPRQGAPLTPTPHPLSRPPLSHRKNMRLRLLFEGLWDPGLVTERTAPVQCRCTLRCGGWALWDSLLQCAARSGSPGR